MNDRIRMAQTDEMAVIYQADTKVPLLALMHQMLTIAAKV